MMYKKNPPKLVLLFILGMLYYCCTNNQKQPETDIVTKPEKMPERISNDLEKTLDDILHNKGKLNDTVRLGYARLDDSIYSTKNYVSFWNESEKWLPLADSLFAFIENSKQQGL